MVKVYKEKCKICDKEIVSLSKTQFKYNFDAHMKAHERKENEKDKKNDSKTVGKG